MILFQGLNDYEIIYLIKDGNELAYEIMFKKYECFIYKKIRDYGISNLYVDEYLQEGLITLNKAIFKFDDSFNKSFMRFFELLLERHFINMLKRNKITYEELNENLFEANDNVLEETVVYYQSKMNFSKFKSKIEQIVYKEYYLENWSIEHISEKYGIETPCIYNAIRRIKKKL